MARIAAIECLGRCEQVSRRNPASEGAGGGAGAKGTSADLGRKTAPVPRVAGAPKSLTQTPGRVDHLRDVQIPPMTQASRPKRRRLRTALKVVAGLGCITSGSRSGWPVDHRRLGHLPRASPSSRSTDPFMANAWAICCWSTPWFGSWKRVSLGRRSERSWWMRPPTVGVPSTRVSASSLRLAAMTA